MKNKYKNLQRGRWYSWVYRKKSNWGKYYGRFFNKKLKQWVYHFQTGPGEYSTILCKDTKLIYELETL